MEMNRCIYSAAAQKAYKEILSSYSEMHENGHCLVIFFFSVYREFVGSPRGSKEKYYGANDEEKRGEREKVRESERQPCKETK